MSLRRKSGRDNNKKHSVIMTEVRETKCLLCKETKENLIDCFTDAGSIDHICKQCLMKGDTTNIAWIDTHNVKELLQELETNHK